MYLSHKVLRLKSSKVRRFKGYLLYGYIVMLLFPLWGLGGFLQAQDFSVYAVRENNEVSFYAQNDYFCPVQTQIRIDNPEIVEQTAKSYYYVVPEKTQKEFLFKLKTKEGDTAKLRFSYNHILGNPDIKAETRDYVHFLPFEHKKVHFVLQGYGGRFSHQRQFALDFKMKEGTEICATREGIVIDLKEDSEVGGIGDKYYDMANYIVIYHQDGTFGYYYHLQKDGVIVEVGQKVNAGDMIGYSGNTGYSSTPHLHFMVKKPIYMKLRSISTRFYTRFSKNKKIKGWRFYKAWHPR
jgi:murein DD-endopeptidase MepM/ murein hydrolase activator NlpD